MKLSKLAVFFCFLVHASYSAAEPPETKAMRDQDAAGRWQADQYRRADNFDKKGEPKKADDVRTYADERVKQGRDAANEAKGSADR